ACGRKARLLEVFDFGVVALSSSVAQLHDVLTVVFLNLLADRAPERDLVVVVDHGVIRQDAAFEVDWNKRGDNRADAAPREFFSPVDAGLPARPVVVIESTRNAGPKQPVLDGEIPEFQRLEDDAV